MPTRWWIVGEGNKRFDHLITDIVLRPWPIIKFWNGSSLSFVLPDLSQVHPEGTNTIASITMKQVWISTEKPSEFSEADYAVAARMVQRVWQDLIARELQALLSGLGSGSIRDFVAIPPQPSKCSETTSRCVWRPTTTLS